MAEFEERNPEQEIAELKVRINSSSEEEVREDIHKYVKDENFLHKAETKKREVDTAVDSGSVPFDIKKDVDAQALKKVVWGIVTSVREGKFQIGDDNSLANKALKKISESIHPEKIDEKTAPYLFDLLQNLINEEIHDVADLADKFSSLDNLKRISPYYEKIQADLIETSREITGESDHALKAKFGVEETKPRKELEERVDIETISRLYEKFPEEKDKLIINALYDKNKLNHYVEDLRDSIKDEKHYEDDNPNLNIEVSEKLKEDIQMLVGKLYQSVDESDPAEFWEKTEQKGGIFYSIEVLGESLKRQIQKLRYMEFGEGSVLSNLDQNKNFYKREYKTLDLEVEVKTRYEDAPGGEDQRTRKDMKNFVKSEYDHEKVSLADYILSVYNSVEDEIGVRKFLHNARALPYHPPGEGGYYAQLARYAEELMPASSIDILFQLPDAQEILAASQIWDKLYEADFAKYNWIHQPAYGQLDPAYKLTSTDRQTLDYLLKLNPDLDPWRAKRALIMGIGDNYSISLRAIETGAYADAPLNLEQGTAVTYASYDKRDSAMFKVFNQFAHENVRFSAETLLMGNLLFLPVEGEDIGGGGWDHSIFMKEMKKSINAYISGKPLEDDKRGLVRIADMINMSAVGSVYSRGAWRDYLSYEGWLVTPEGRLGALDSWKAIENIGIAPLKDLISNLTSPSTIWATSSFYKELFDSTDSEVKRKELFSHIYKKYFNKNENVPQDEIDVAFSKLERGDKIEDRYKDFFHKVLGKAFKQRIPTKFIRIERNKFVTGRERAWKILFDESNLEIDLFDKAFKDILAAEVELKKHISFEIWKNLKIGKKLHEIDIDYELTDELLERYLREKIAKKEDGSTDEERVQNALNVYKKMIDIIDTKIDAEAFGKKYGRGEFPFEIATEEIDRSLLAHRAAGERTPARALGDIEAAEKNVANVISGYFDVLMKTAIDPNQKFDGLIESLDKVKKQLDALHGLDRAYKITHHLAALTISFFRKDTKSVIFPLKFFRFGKKNSLAAEFIRGPFRGVWEWDSMDSNNFLIELERNHIVSRDPYDVSRPPTYEKKPLLHFKMFGKEINLGSRTIRKPDFKYHSKSLRKNFRIKKRDIAWEYINKFLPLIALALLIIPLLRASKEELGQKK